MFIISTSQNIKPQQINLSGFLKSRKFLNHKNHIRSERGKIVIVGRLVSNKNNCTIFVYTVNHSISLS